MELVDFIYKIVNQLPDNEEHCLSFQIRKCVISIPSNIAEGYGRKYTAEYRRFLKIVRASLYELQTQIEIAARLKYINQEYIHTLETNSTEIEKMLNSLIRKLKNS